MRTQMVITQQTPAEFLQESAAVDFADLLPCPEAAEEYALGTPAISPAQAPDRDELFLSHLPIVRFVARRVYERLPAHVDFEDLVSAGTVGLLDAASKFDWSKQVQFKSYAQFRIRGAILDSLRTTDWSPRQLRRKGRVMAEAIRALSSKLGRTPTDVEIATEMNMDLLSYQQMTGDLKGLELNSLNAERTEESGEEELEFLPAPASDDPLASCIEAQSREQLAAAIETLPEKERLVLTLYYFEEMTMKEIGLALGVVESRVSQIRSNAVSRLRTAMGQKTGAKDARNRVRKEKTRQNENFSDLH